MTNKEAVTYGNELIQCTTGQLREFAEIATRALRSPGAGAMREADQGGEPAHSRWNEDGVDYCGQCGRWMPEGTGRVAFDGTVICKGRPEKPLPAPEVQGRKAPEAITNWVKWYDTHPHGHAGSDRAVRDWIRKEYGI